MRSTDILVPDWPDLGAGIAVGIDLQPVAEVLQALTEHEDRYLARVFTLEEQRACGVGREPVEVVAERLSARFAAKEALLKALRVGSDSPGFLDIEVVSHPDGAPTLRLEGAADDLARRDGITGISVSITHGGGLAMAIVMVMYERRSTPSGDVG